MKQNMGSLDRILRFIAAIVIAALYFTNVITGTTAIILLVLAGVFVLTSLFGYCPLYPIFSVNTCHLGGKKTHNT